MEHMQCNKRKIQREDPPSVIKKVKDYVVSKKYIIVQRKVVDTVSIGLIESEFGELMKNKKVADELNGYFELATIRILVTHGK